MQRCDRGMVFCFLDSLREGSPYADRNSAEGRVYPEHP